MTKPEARGAHGLQVLPGEERRRSQRVIIRVPVTIEFAVGGKKATVKATTASVNDHGAMLLCSRGFAVEAKLQVENDRSHQKQLCRVTRTPFESAEGYLIPVEFGEPAPSFWGISFPPTNWKPPDD